MLNLPVAMIKEILSLVLPIILLSPISGLVPTVEITTPQQGQVAKGTVSISGTISSDGFSSADVSYAYDGDESNSWFLIASVSQPVANDVIAAWDTTTISDGDYQIKVTARYSTGETKEVVVHQILVRNYTSGQETPVVTQAVTQGIEATPTLTLIPQPQVTPFPTNAASLEVSEVKFSLQQGAVLGIIVLVVLGIYALIHWLKYYR
jgi:hypothetical protein